MNKNFNTIVELTEKELACVIGGGIIVVGRFEGEKEGRFGGESRKIKYRPRPIP